MSHASASPTTAGDFASYQGSLSADGRWVAFTSFATNLDQDGPAVRASLRLPWSSGQAEGQVNRLKLLKRSMYGRAKLDLLRPRFLLEA